MRPRSNYMNDYFVFGVLYDQRGFSKVAHALEGLATEEALLEAGLSMLSAILDDSELPLEAVCASSLQTTLAVIRDTNKLV